MTTPINKPEYKCAIHESEMEVIVLAADDAIQLRCNECAVAAKAERSEDEGEYVIFYVWEEELQQLRDDTPYGPDPAEFYMDKLIPFISQVANAAREEGRKEASSWITIDEEEMIAGTSAAQARKEERQKIITLIEGMKKEIGYNVAAGHIADEDALGYSQALSALQDKINQE